MTTQSPIYSLYIINKAGGLIYQKDFVTQQKRAGNDYLRLLSTFHSLHAIAGRGIQISPLNQSNPSNNQPDPTDFTHISALTKGINSVECKDFRLVCFPTLTGLKFVVSTINQSNNQSTGEWVDGDANKFLTQVYALYCDYVLKNAFYELEMPIRCEQFDAKVVSLNSAITSR